MSLGFLLPNRSSAVVWRGPKKTAMVRQFLTDVLWPPIDYLLVDTPPGTSDEHISLAEQLLKVASSTTATDANVAGADTRGKPHLAGAVVVTTPQAVATADVRKELNFCAKVGIRVLGVVENMSGYVCECCGVSTNLFGKGGGEVMSADFGVKFLGGVPIDRQWGVLVEEGKRPTYGGVAKVEDEEEGSDIGDRKEMVAEGEKELGLLVDKYRSCSLSGLFGGITKEVVQIVEQGHAGL
jgi:Mrp family chromosome partitioning ATPase